VAKAPKQFIQKAIKHPGALTAKAKAAGMSVAQYAANPPAGITTETKRQINFYEGVLKNAKHPKAGKHG
jgi:hypothetical protein